MSEEAKTEGAAKPKMYILQEGKFYKPDGTKLKVGEAIELTDAQVAAFGNYFKAEAVALAEAEVAEEAAKAALAAAAAKTADPVKK